MPKNIEGLLETLLKETQPIVRPTSMADFADVADKPFSLDQAIDRYLVQYERESIPTSEVFESAQVNKLVTFLFEQGELDDGEEDVPDLDLDADDASADLDLGGDDESDDTKDAEEDIPPVMNTPKINLQDFVRSVARLINNVGSLIDLNTIILNRAEKYIQSNYDERTAKEMLDVLDTTYDLRPVSTEENAETRSEYPDPTAAVTGPVGG